MCFFEKEGMDKRVQHTYHLYHHQPEPLAVTDVQDQAWLINNGANYGVVALIRAATPEQAYEGLLARTRGQGFRSVEIKTSNIMRESLPGDVLVGEKHAWMLFPDGKLRRISYTPDPSWKSYLHDSGVKCLSWAPDGKHLAACGSHVLLHSLERDDVPSYAVASYRRHGSSTVCALAWSPDGTRIASGGYDAEVHIWRPDPEGEYANAARGSILICRTLESGYSSGQRITSLAWAPDARTLLAGRDRGDLVRWDALSGECLRIISRHQGPVTALAYAPDGTRVASASEDSTLSIWSLKNPDQEVICWHAGAVLSFAWSPDGAYLVSACQHEQSLQSWDAFSGRPGQRIPLSVSSTQLLTIQTIAWSPNGDVLAAGCDDGTVQLIDMHRFRHIQTYRAAHAQVHCIAWSPDGCLLDAGERGFNGVQVWQVERRTRQEGDTHNASLASLKPT
jgi:WD40 repeat protein